MSCGFACVRVLKRTAHIPMDQEEKICRELMLFANQLQKKLKANLTKLETSIEI